MHYYLTLENNLNQCPGCEGFPKQAGGVCMYSRLISLLWASLFAGSLLLSGCRAEPTPYSGQAAGLNHKFYVGNITDHAFINSDFGLYWNQIAPDSEGRWSTTEPMRDNHYWTPLDRTYSFAKQNGLLFLQYALFNGNTHSSWLASLANPDLALEAEEWIQTYCARYPGTDLLEVVSEALPGHQPSVEASRAFGKNWIQQVYQLARRHCPNSVLIFSDYNVLQGETAEFIALAKPLVAAGLIDGIGVEAHNVEALSAVEIQNALDRLWNELQVPIYITAYDVALVDDNKQLEVFQRQFPVFYQHPHVKGITLYGYEYGKTWVTGSGLVMPDGSLRPAMSWLMDYIEKNPR